MKIGIKSLARCAIAVTALLAIRYSVHHQHVDVWVPAACVAGVAKDTVPGDGTCIYRNVSVRGHVMQKNFEVFGPTGVGFFTENASVMSRGDDAGFTWRSLALLMIAAAMWVPSLFPLFKRDGHVRDPSWKSAVYNPKQYRRDR
ncbi:hypothetical protein F3J14_04290 [Burkholderia sp. Tr-862]|uniref:hypothetical protein n=1 Tax=Burkholderia sp. Tr-862 TaxID=2608331 RepID=UPI0014193F88|nr:hypothetical protein [Burkholderia sp. Tr-862]NIF40132.1 hypothetical protein [Burkholderia sp. Tr-862]